MAEVDNLSIAISASSEGAASSINHLISTLQTLGATLRSVDAARFVSELARIRNEAVGAASALDRLTTAVRRAGTTGNNAGIERVASTLESVRNNADAATTSLVRYATALIAIQSRVASFAGNANNAMPLLEGPVGNQGQPIYTEFVDQAEQMSEGMESVASATQRAESRAMSFRDILRGLSSRISSIGPNLRELSSAAVSIGRVSFSPVTNALGSLGNAAKSAYSSVTGLFSTISRIAFYRLIRTAIKMVTQALSEGIKTLYHYSETFSGTFYQSMNSIATSANYVKNSIAAMVSPLITAVTPVLTSIADKIVDVFNLINQFIARLTGQSTYTAAKKVSTLWDDATKKTAASTQKANNSASKSTKDTAKGISDTVKKTADEIKRYTLGFDELNILGKNKDNGGADSGAGGGSSGGLGDIALPTSSGASSSGTDYGSLFETRKIDGAVSDFADAIRQAFENQDWQGLGSLIGNKINSALDSVNWSGIGRKVGTTLNGVIETEYYLLDTINFTNIGKHIAEFLNNAIGQINFNTLGRLMVKKLTIIPDMIIGFLVEFNWGQAAANLSDFAIGCFDEITKWFRSHDWEELGGILFQKIDDAVSQVKFADIAKSIFKALGSALRATSLLTIGFYEGIAGKIKAWFIKDIMNHKWTDIAFNILSAIGKGFSDIGTWVFDNIIDPFMSELLGEDWNELKPVAKNIFDVINENWIANNFAVELAVKVINNAKRWVEDTIKWWNEEGKDKAVEIAANVRNDAEKWWKDVQNWWAAKVENVKEFGTTVKNNAEIWWALVKGWWKEKVGNVQDFVVNVSNTSATWWSNVKEWWKSILGNNDGTNFTEFRINIMNKAAKWLQDIIAWWRDILGLNDGTHFTEFKVNIMKTAFTWFGNVVSWWNEKLGRNDGSSFTEFTVNVRQNAWDWWNSVSSAWYNWTRNLTLNANARIQGYYYTGAGGGGGFAEGGSIDAYGNIRRFANGGVIHAYASGTAQATGSLFLAGEAGPEIVGHVGGRTEVLNRSQLAATMYSAVNAAMAPAAANFANAAAYMYQGVNGYTEDDMDTLIQLVRTGSEATERQNELLRQQNEYLRQINAKEFTTEISTADINRAQARSNRRAGTTIVPMTT